LGSLFLLTLSCAAGAGDFSALCADRAAIERVYYNHRLGTKPPYEQTMPPALVEKLVRQDLHKEAVLKQVYGLEITPAMLEAELQRINTTTRAPDVLREIKAALGNDADRFARAVARPIIVERLLRGRFENDDALHAPGRQQAEKIRAALLAARGKPVGSDQLLLLKRLGSNHVVEIAWRLDKRPDEPQDGRKELAAAQARFGPNAQVRFAPQDADRKPTSYFEDLSPELQRVLRVQLRRAGDISAVIETPGGFLLYLCKEKDATTLNVAALSLPKRSYGQWLAEQAD